MENKIYNSLQLREIFHVEFLRWFGRQARSGHYALKGGVNLRLFFKSFRYSEDMDLDVKGISVSSLKNTVMNILEATAFHNTLMPFGVDRVVLPDMSKAKQTLTTQQFKVHLITASGEDLFTKIEFSRRGFMGDVVVHNISDTLLRAYKLTPLQAPHYDAYSAIEQKVLAMAMRSSIQARDIFDLYLLNSQRENDLPKRKNLTKAVLKKADENIFEVSFEQFRDTVVSYLTEEDQKTYDVEKVWDEIKLEVSHLIEKLRS